MTRRALCAAAVVILSWWTAGDAAAQTAVKPAPTPGIQTPSPSAAEAPLGLRAGSAKAAVQFVLFCDIEDVACGRLVVVLRRVIEDYPDRVGSTFRHHAAEEHTRSPFAYRSALAAARQGAGWDMLDMACANTDRLDDAGLRSMAVQLGLDVERFVADLGASDVMQVLDDDEQEAKSQKLENGPALFVNGTRFVDVFTYDALVAVLK